MQLIYERMMGGQCEEETMRDLLGFSADGDDADYIRDALEGTLEHEREIDGAIEPKLVNWSIDRIARVDLAILRLAVYEILYRDDVPDAVAVNEAVELAKTFSTDEAGPFVNGLLGSLLREKKA